MTNCIIKTTNNIVYYQDKFLQNTFVINGVKLIACHLLAAFHSNTHEKGHGKCIENLTK